MSGTRPESSAEFIARLKDPLRWRSALFDVALWFVFGLCLTTLLSRTTPGYPILVGTPSIQTGIYWLDRMHPSYYVGDVVTFPFEPVGELKGRYGQHLVHTKYVAAVEGDVVESDGDNNVRVCRTNPLDLQQTCTLLGKAQPFDSNGRKLTPWLPPKHQYTLRQGELWIRGIHPLSLDSRYHGPIPASIVRGRASLLIAYGEPPEEEKTSWVGMK